eukprot:scaffold9825_cov203-Cylindrotheca_fusiformis.AAC.7
MGSKKHRRNTATGAGEAGVVMMELENEANDEPLHGENIGGEGAMNLLDEITESCFVLDSLLIH